MTINIPVEEQQKPGIDAHDRKLIVATQNGLPLVERPYDEIARNTGLSPGDVKQRMKSMLERGVIRRIGVVPNHYKLGFTANGMSVWNVNDDVVDEIGKVVGELEYVTHCYKRPRHLPIWPYNLFAMVHGTSRNEVEDKVAAIAVILKDASNGHEIVYSSRILKKTGLRLGVRPQNNLEKKQCSD